MHKMRLEQLMPEKNKEAIHDKRHRSNLKGHPVAKYEIIWA